MYNVVYFPVQICLHWSRLFKHSLSHFMTLREADRAEVVDWQGAQLTRLGNFLTLVRTSQTSTQNNLYNDTESVQYPLHPQPLVNIQHICIYSLDLLISYSWDLSRHCTLKIFYHPFQTLPLQNVAEFILDFPYARWSPLADSFKNTKLGFIQLSQILKFGVSLPEIPYLLFILILCVESGMAWGSSDDLAQSFTRRTISCISYLDSLKSGSATFTAVTGACCPAVRG